jgi:hypothetical protein
MIMVVGGGAQIWQPDETGWHTTMQGGGACIQHGVMVGGGAGRQQGVVTQQGVGVGACMQHGGMTVTQQTGVGAAGGRLMTLVMVTVTCCFWSWSCFCPWQFCRAFLPASQSAVSRAAVRLWLCGAAAAARCGVTASMRVKLARTSKGGQ